MFEPNSIWAQGAGVDLHLSEWAVAEADGLTVLGVHGITANGRSWFNVAPPLAARHRVLGLDLRGRGLSDKPPTGYSADLHVADIIAVLDDLGLDRVALMGHSLGAYITLACAARHPDRVDRAVLFDAGADLTVEEWGKVTKAIQPALERLGQVFRTADDLIDILRKNPDLQPFTPEIEAWYRWGLEPVAGGVADRVQPEHIAEERQNVLALDAPALYPNVTCPVLILRATVGFGPEKGLVLPERATNKLLQDLPRGELADVQGSNHYSIVLHDQPQRDEALARFLGA
ncbi:MAG: alpha/beta hydrolase [Proteobacteria bacterium]|nr:alpha/beta hydrolase [Pseudomonadota bacterium]MBU1741522.1 alpha/beta hydrolase [Pseudomonadota bacterium]